MKSVLSMLSSGRQQPDQPQIALEYMQGDMQRTFNGYFGSCAEKNQCMTMKMPKVLECALENWAYNAKKSCHAMAITVGDPGGEPSCDTFFTAVKHGGVMDMTAGGGPASPANVNSTRILSVPPTALQLGS